VRYQIRNIGGLPHSIRSLVETPFPQEVFEAISRMNTVVVAGASFPKRLEDEFVAKLDSASKGKRIVKVVQAFGMTEVGAVRDNIFCANY
jgi:acyl-coenzyme A synthetase/AMP-(fatty) acid ligase